MALLLGRHYEFPQCGIIKEKLLLLLNTYCEQHGGHRSVVVKVDHRQKARQVASSGSNEEQSAHTETNLNT
jgi:hypothetical protein